MMRPEGWNPPVELSAAEQGVMQRIKRAKLFGFLRRKRHELFDTAFQERCSSTMLLCGNASLSVSIFLMASPLRTITAGPRDLMSCRNCSLLVSRRTFCT